ncbi:MAG TPA: IPT/TIG domain-containing protein [Thermoanaerobaculaceae bacterium]|nr:IPT/TIG domain-containing protein [Thermoanaerobaculaceae bacterium]HRS15639.1 IPT/TIG domain-containing protein [Thermoanaerobaculaceae bacterium]
MKQRPLIVVLALGLALALAGCSADSPSAPKPSPTPAALSIALDSSASSAEVGSAVVFTARVTQGGANAPDNTSVTFSLYGCPGAGVASDPSFENGSCEVVRTTQNGAATATLVGRTSGVYQVTARVPGQAISKNVRYFDPVSPRNLAIYGVEPDQGSADGGQQVTIRGRGFAPPLDVVFKAEGTQRTAVVASVNSAGTEIVVITPKAPIPVTESLKTDIIVTAGKGTASEVSETMERAFIYTTTTPGAPAIYQIVPAQGLDRGGDQVTIYGANFYAPVTVKFGDENVQSVSVSADHASLVVLSPQHSRGLNDVGPQQVDVRVVTYGAAGTPDEAKYTAVRTNGWTWLPPTTEPQAPVIYSVSPAKGSPRGGGEVTIRGANLCWEYNTLTGRCAAAPQVTFLPTGFGEKSASVLSVAEDGSQIVVVTPAISANPVLTDVVASIRVTNAKGSATLDDSFTFLSEAGDPQIYSVSPNKGSARGGDTVVIYGKFFLEPVQVEFSVGGLAQVVGVNADKTEITIRTPAWGVGPLGEDRLSDITVRTQYGTGRDREATLSNAFLFIAEAPTPELYALSPNSGPIDGGTRVTITGQGFQTPVQVYFGDRQAQVITSNFFQVVCIAPSITPSQPSTPTTVDVTVLNVTTGKRSNALPFRYGEAMFLSAISPNRGPADAPTTVTIYGQGFVGPVEVVTLIGGQAIQASVRSVSGTEIIADIQPLPTDRRDCGVVQAGVRVTNLNSNISASGLNFYYESPTPLITSALVTAAHITTPDNTVPMRNPTGTGTCDGYAWNDYTVVVRGKNFQQSGSASAMVVSIPGVTADIPTTWVGPEELTFTLPDLTAVVMQEISCTTGTGSCGLQYVQTPIALTLKNLRSGCEDTLNGAIVIVPCDPSCRPVSLTSLDITDEPSTGVRVNTPFAINLDFQPRPLTSPVTVTLTYVGFTASPASVTIPANFNNPWPVTITPTSVGSGNILAQAGSGVCAVPAVSSQITILPPPLNITTTCPLPAGVVGTPYTQTLAATGGTPPYAWSISEGALPAGLSVTGNQITGTPTATGTFDFTLQVRDATNPVQLTAQLPCSITINATLAVEKSGVNAGANTITSSPTGINCGATCSGTFGKVAVTLTASPAAPATWGGDCSGCVGTTCQVTMTTNRSCTADFP